MADEEKHKHLEMIQDVVNRLSTNSFLIERMDSGSGFRHACVLGREQFCCTLLRFNPDIDFLVSGRLLSLTGTIVSLPLMTACAKWTMKTLISQ